MKTLKVQLDKGVYLFVKCFSEHVGKSVEEAIVDLIRMFKFLSGDDKGIEVLRKIVSSSNYYIPVLGKPVEVCLKLTPRDTSYLEALSSAVGVDIGTAVKLCLATLARILQNCFPQVKCRLKGYSFAKYRLPDFKYMVLKNKYKGALS